MLLSCVTRVEGNFRVGSEALHRSMLCLVHFITFVKRILSFNFLFVFRCHRFELIHHIKLPFQVVFQVLRRFQIGWLLFSASHKLLAYDLYFFQTWSTASIKLRLFDSWAFNLLFTIGF